MSKNQRSWMVSSTQAFLMAIPSSTTECPKMFYIRLVRIQNSKLIKTDEDNQGLIALANNLMAVKLIKTGS